MQIDFLESEIKDIYGFRKDIVSSFENIQNELFKAKTPQTLTSNYNPTNNRLRFKYDKTVQFQDVSFGDKKENLPLKLSDQQTYLKNVYLNRYLNQYEKNCLCSRTNKQNQYGSSQGCLEQRLYSQRPSQMNKKYTKSISSVNKNNFYKQNQHRWCQRSGKPDSQVKKNKELHVQQYKRSYSQRNQRQKAKSSAKSSRKSNKKSNKNGNKNVTHSKDKNLTQSQNRKSQTCYKVSQFSPNQTENTVISYTDFIKTKGNLLQKGRNTNICNQNPLSLQMGKKIQKRMSVYRTLYGLTEIQKIYAKQLRKRDQVIQKMVNNPRFVKKQKNKPS